MIENRSVRFFTAFPFLGGICQWQTFNPELPSVVTWGFAALAPLLLFLSWRRASPRSAFIAGLLYGLPAYFGGLSWLFAMAEHLDEGVSLAGFEVASSIGVVLVVLAISVGAVGAGLVALMSRSGPAMNMLLFAMAWALLEWLQPLAIPGFPTISLGYALIDSPLAGYAPVFGVTGVSFVLALVGASLGGLLVREPGQLALGLGLPVLVLLLGWGLGRIEWTTPVGRSLHVALINGDITQAHKYERYRVIHAVRRYTELSRSARGADLVVWPESSSAYAFEQVYPLIRTELLAMASGGRQVFIGAYLRDRGVTRNVLVDAANLDHHYTKRRLIPFAEYQPDWVRDLAAWLPRVAMSQLWPGESSQALLSVGDVSFVSLICYENLFAGLSRDQFIDAGFAVVVSDLAWFEGTSAAHQLALVSRMRALEAARPLVQSSNLGETMLVDHGGRVVQSVTGSRQLLQGILAPRQGATPYLRFGDAWLWLGTMLLLGGVCLETKSERNQKGHRNQKGQSH